MEFYELLNVKAKCTTDDKAKATEVPVMVAKWVIRRLLSGVIHGRDTYWGGGFESHWGHGWSVYPCKAIN